MLVKNFMLPRDKVILVEKDSLLAPLLDKMLETNARSMVVVSGDARDVPVGLVTKTDMVRAYQLGMDPNAHQVQEIMGNKIEKVLDTDTRDTVAKHFEDTNNLNAFVFDKSGHFVGLVHALDIALEVSLDSKAWPWNREGLMEKYKVTTGSPKSPKSTLKGPGSKTPESLPRHTFMDIAGDA